MAGPALSGCLTLSLVGVLAGAPLAAAQAEPPRRALPAAAFNTARFEAALDRQMKGLPKGWSFAVADRHGVRVSGAGGWAQAPGDGDVVMSADTASGIGSVTKMLAGFATCCSTVRAFATRTAAVRAWTRWPKWPRGWRSPTSASWPTRTR